ncbi:hypothetical protein ACFVGN_43175, partial [Streptomyces sp. NPDC057757]
VQSLWQSLCLYRDLQHPGGEAESLNRLGTLLLDVGWSDPRTHYEPALLIARTISSPFQEMLALDGLGSLLQERGHSSAGEAHLHEAFAIAERLGTPYSPRLGAHRMPRTDRPTAYPEAGTDPTPFGGG